MAKFKFYDIAKANAEITRLETENTELKAAKPAAGAEAQQLTDALSTNEQISTDLTKANTDLAAANLKATNVSAQLETAQGQVNAIGAAVKSACTALKIEIPANATSVEMVTLMQNSIPTLASKKAQEITAGAGAGAAPVAAADAKTAATAGKQGMGRLLAAAGADLTAAGYVPKSK